MTKYISKKKWKPQGARRTVISWLTVISKCGTVRTFGKKQEAKQFSFKEAVKVSSGLPTLTLERVNK